MRPRLLILVVVIVFYVVFLRQVAVFVELLFFLLVKFLVLFVVFLELIGNRIQGHRMGLRHLELGLALGAAEDLSLLNFVFVYINFGGTLWATEHGSILRFNLGATIPEISRITTRRIIYRGGKSQLDPFHPHSV